MIASEVVMFMQQFCGVNVIAYYSSEIFLDANFSETSALAASLGFGRQPTKSSGLVHKNMDDQKTCQGGRPIVGGATRLLQLLSQGCTLQEGERTRRPGPADDRDSALAVLGGMKGSVRCRVIGPRKAAPAFETAPPCPSTARPGSRGRALL